MGNPIQDEELGPREAFSTLKKMGGGETISLRETCEEFLKHHVPQDIPDDETDEHAEVRRNFIRPSDGPNEEPFLLKEVQMALRVMKPSMAPGHDLVEVLVLKRVNRFIARSVSR